MHTEIAEPALVVQRSTFRPLSHPHLAPGATQWTSPNMIMTGVGEGPVGVVALGQGQGARGADLVGSRQVQAFKDDIGLRGACAVRADGARQLGAFENPQLHPIPYDGGVMAGARRVTDVDRPARSRVRAGRRRLCRSVEARAWPCFARSVPT